MALDNRTQRLQVTLQDSTVQMIDDFTKSGQFDSRSGFLNQAARQFAIRLKKAHLKRSLRDGYKMQSKRDNALNEEWSGVANELLWDTPQKAK